MRLDPQGAPTLDRRRFLQATAGTAAAAGVSGPLVWPGRTAASGGSRKVKRAAQANTGQSRHPGTAAAHSRVGSGRPFRNPALHRRHVAGVRHKPGCTITDFRGFSAVAFHIGSATDSDGKTPTTSRPTCGPTRARTSMRRANATSGRSASSEWTCSSPVRARRRHRVHDFNGGILASGPLLDPAGRRRRAADPPRRTARRDAGTGSPGDGLVPVLRPQPDSGHGELPHGVGDNWSVRGAWLRGTQCRLRTPPLHGPVRRRPVDRRLLRLEFGFSFPSNPGVSTNGGGFAEMGRERNGEFLD